MSATIQPSETRRLATILSIDIAGFSRASEVDDVAAARHVRALRGLSESTAAAHFGRVFNTAGDGLMLEFPTVASGVAAALDIADSARAEPGLPRIRMGLHVGDVTVLANGDLIGAGVNVAARVQQRAVPGEILTTGEVRNLAGGRSDVVFTDYGTAPLDKMSRQVALFGLARPGDELRHSRGRRGNVFWWTASALLLVIIAAVTVYLILPRAEERAVANEEAQRPTIPVVAVLAFTNLSGDPQLNYFSDGITEEIQDTLSRIPGLRVISRSSSSMAGANAQDTRALARSLNATHVLTGSVRSSGTMLRVSAQLLLGESGAIVWSETFERPTSETLAVQDEIATRVARALRVVAPQTQKTPSIDPRAVELYLKGREAWRTGGDMARAPEAAVDNLEEAVRLAPDFARGWAALASAYAQRQNWYVGAEQQAFIDKALDAANRAVSLDPSIGEAYIVLGRFEPSNDLAVRETWFEKAIQAEPYDDDTQMLYATFWLWEVGRMAEARRMLTGVYEIDPLSDLPTSRYAESLGMVGDIAALEQVATPLPGRNQEMQFLWQKVFFAKLVAGDFNGAREALAKLEAAFTAYPEKMKPKDIEKARGVMNDFLAVREHNDEAARQRLMTHIAEEMTRGQASAFSAIFDYMLIGRMDLAFQVARTLYIDRGYKGETFDPENFPVAYPYGRVPMGDALGYFGQAMQNDPAIWDIFAATGHAQFWLDSGVWPDFCRRPDLGYDCKVEAEKAINARRTN